MRTIFVWIWVLWIQWIYQYYNLTIPVWGQIFNNTRTVLKKTPYEYGFLHRYGDARTCTVILRVWVITDIYWNMLIYNFLLMFIFECYILMNSFFHSFHFLLLRFPYIYHSVFSTIFLYLDKKEVRHCEQIWWY